MTTMLYSGNSKVARMVQPERFKTEDYNVWSGGRGIDVWTMLCACVAGDFQTVKDLVVRDGKLAVCEYGWPLRIAVRGEKNLVLIRMLHRW